ncbi:MAG: prepilin-type N-terminal cleavage/methylation domain-containing protein [Rickettsiales bacterium]
MHKNNKRQKRGFSLVELSIVILITSVLIGGIVATNSLTESARLSAARSMTTSSPVKDVDGLILWLETTMPQSFDVPNVENGQSISTWFDLSPEGNNSVIGNAPTYTSDEIRGLPALRFDGVNDYMESILPLTLISNQLQIFLVCRRGGSFPVIDDVSPDADISTSALVLDGGNGNGDDKSGIKYVIVGKEGAGGNLTTSRNDTDLSTASHPGIGVSYIQSTRFDGSNNIVHLNGVEQAFVNSTGDFNVGRILIGARYFDNSVQLFYNGSIAEIIVFDRPLNNNERMDIEQYLSRKWDIEITQ